MALNYLTVQDMLFINFQVMKGAQVFETLNLEEAVYYQYASGQSTDLVGQGARFLTGFARKAPFVDGNRATAFVGLVSFLEANGKALAVSDKEARTWLEPLWDDREAAANAIEGRIGEGELPTAYGVPDYQEICLSVIARYESTLGQFLTKATA